MTKKKFANPGEAAEMQFNTLLCAKTISLFSKFSTQTVCITKGAGKKFLLGGDDGSGFYLS